MLLLGLDGWRRWVGFCSTEFISGSAFDTQNVGFCWIVSMLYGIRTSKKLSCSMNVYRLRRWGGIFFH